MIEIVNAPSLHTALLETVEQCKQFKNQDVEIVVPDKLSLFMEKFLFEKLNISASFNLKVSTFNRFAKKNCDIPKEKQISKIGSIILVHKILNDNAQQMKVLKNKLFKFSYAEEIFNTICQLKASQITPAEMLQFASNNKQLQDKIKDIGLVYDNYENLKAGLLDASDMFLSSSITIAEGRQNANILFVGFEDFTSIEYSLICQLGLNCNVKILNCFSKNNKAIYNNEIVERIKNLCFFNNIGLKTSNSSIKTTDLKNFLNNNLFSLKNEKFVLNDELVKVFENTSSRGEVECVAREIKNQVLAGYKFKDFGVACFGLENQIENFKQIFEKYEINYYVDCELALNKSVIYKFFCDLFKFNFEYYNLTHLIDLINSPFFAVQENEKQIIIDKLLNFNFKTKITSKLNLDLQPELNKKLVEFLNVLTFNKIENCNAVVEKLKEIYAVLSMQQVVESLIDKVGVEEKIILTKSHDVIFEIFEDILKFNSQILPTEFFEIFEHIGGVVKISNLPLMLDAVKIVDATQNMEVFNKLIVVGCNADVAPQAKADCGIITDDEIAELNFKNKLNPTIAHINKLSKLNLFNLMTMFESELIVSYSKLPSEVVKQLLNLILIKVKGFDINIVPIKNFVFNEYCALSQWDYIENLCKTQKNAVKTQKNITKTKKFLNLSQKNLKTYKDKSISASQLENYFRCPFNFFMSRILKIQPRLQLDLLAFDVGNILHEIMFKFYTSKKEINDIYEFCKTQIFEFVDKDARLSGVNNSMLTNLIDEATREIQAVKYIDKNSKFVPTKFEFGFEDKQIFASQNKNFVGKVDRVDCFNDLLRIVDYKTGKADANLKELYYGNKLQLFLYAQAMENLQNKKVVGSFYLPLKSNYERDKINNTSLKGFFVNEDFVVSAMDKRLTPGEKSDIAEITMTKDFKAASRSDKVMTDQQFNLAKNYAIKVSQNAIKEIESGYISPSPSEVSSPCSNCCYQQICLKNCCGILERSTKKISMQSLEETDE